MRLAPKRLLATGRRRVLIVVVVLVVVAGFGGWMIFRPGSSTAEAQALTYTVSKTTLKQTVSASGSLEAADEADLDFAVSGTVTHVYVKAGQKVKKGQALARIDDTTLEASYQSAKAALSAAETAYSDDADADAGSTQLASDSAQIASARATLSQAADNLADATLRATISGTVASRDLEVGDTVSGSSSNGSSGLGGTDGTGSTTSSTSTSSSSAFVIVKPGRFVVTASVSADDISSVKKGMQVTLTVGGSSSTSSTGGFGGFGGFGGLPGGITFNRSGGTGNSSGSSGSTSSSSSSTSTVFGTVTEVSMVADTSSSTTTFPVTVTVTGKHKKLYAGTSVTAAITTKQLTNVLVVPALALSSSNGKTYVEKVADGKTVKTEVTVGQTYGSQTEVTKGLSAGDKIQLATGFGSRGGANRSSGGGGQRSGGFPAGGFGGGQ